MDENSDFYGPNQLRNDVEKCLQSILELKSTHIDVDGNPCCYCESNENDPQTNIYTRHVNICANTIINRIESDTDVSCHCGEETNFQMTRLTGSNICEQTGMKDAEPNVCEQKRMKILKRRLKNPFGKKKAPPQARGDDCCCLKVETCAHKVETCAPKVETCAPKVEACAPKVPDLEQIEFRKDPCGRAVDVTEPDKTDEKVADILVQKIMENDKDVVAFIPGQHLVQTQAMSCQGGEVCEMTKLEASTCAQKAVDVCADTIVLRNRVLRQQFFSCWKTVFLIFVVFCVAACLVGGLQMITA